MNKPAAVLISDVHYNLTTLPLADAATRQAIAKANGLKVPLIVAGDLHDTKANMRAECVNAMLKTFLGCHVDCYILRGNHDSLNEKSSESSLSFLHRLDDLSYHCVVNGAQLVRVCDHMVYLIPYHHDPEELKAYLLTIPKGSTLIMHQGVQGSNMGDYVQDKSALPKEYFEDFRVISGHYHTRQDIVCGRPRQGAVGLFSYIGNPYSLGFGEANDPPKGFQVLMDDGSLEFVPTNLRRHIVWEMTYDVLCDFSNARNAYPPTVSDEDLVWVKISGSKEQLLPLNRAKVQQHLGVDIDFRLDLIPTDTAAASEAPQNLSQGELLDNLIDSMAHTSDERKASLKDLWRKIASN